MGFELFGSIGLDGTGFTRTLRAKESEAQTFGANVSRSFAGIGAGLTGALAGAFGVGALINHTQQVVNNISTIKDLSEQYSITTDEVQELQEAAARAGLSFSNFGSALDRVNEARQQAAQGNKELADTFARVGAAASMSDLQVLRRLATLDRTAFGDIVGVKNERTLAALQNLGTLYDMYKVNPATVKRIDDLDDKLRNLRKTGMALMGEVMSDVLGGDITALSTKGLATRWLKFFNKKAGGGGGGGASDMPGVFVGINNAGDDGVFLGTKAEKDKLEIKKTELALEQAIAKLAFEKLSPAQQEKQLQEQINQLKADAAELQKGGEFDRAFANQNLTLAAQKELQLLGLKKRGEADTKLSDGWTSPYITEALAKVGSFSAFAGGGAGDALSVQKESRDFLRDIRDNTKSNGSTAGWP